MTELEAERIELQSLITILPVGTILHKERDCWIVVCGAIDRNGVHHQFMSGDKKLTDAIRAFLYEYKSVGFSAGEDRRN